MKNTNDQNIFNFWEGLKQRIIRYIATQEAANIAMNFGTLWQSDLQQLILIY